MFGIEWSWVWADIKRHWLRLIYRFNGCNGEGFYKDENGKVHPCYRKGCH